MDLYEYQAKELFAAHGVPVLPGRTVRRRRRGGGRGRAELGTAGGRQGPGEDRRPRQGRRREARRDPGRGPREGRGDPRHGHQGPHGAPGAGHRGQRHRGGVLRLLPARPGQPHLPGDGSAEGGMEIEQLAVERPDALARIPVDAIAGRRRGQGRRDRRRRQVPGRRWPTRSPTCSSSCGRPSSARTPPWSRSTRWSRDADGQVVALDGKVTLDDNADFRHPDHAALVDTARREPARGEGQGEGPQLRQARRRGRHHRQRRRPGDVHPGRRRLRRRGARRGEARELPRHRRRRVAPR